MTDRRAFITAALAAPVAIAAPAIATPSFNPAIWVRKFIAMGGTINLSKDGPRYSYSVEDMDLCKFVMDCNSRPLQWAAVRAYASDLLR